MKILNLFAGIGGNRTLWGDKHQITAVEYDPDIAAIYKKRFPNDIVIVGDAYDYLIKHYKEFDFIWGSPPCPTHSRTNTFRTQQGLDNQLPDLRLYSLIIFLQKWFYGKWVIENVIPYYKPLIKPTIELGRHYFWTNFMIKPREFKRKTPHQKSSISHLKEEYSVDIDFQISDKRKVLRNCVLPELGKYILDQVGNKQKQTTLI